MERPMVISDLTCSYISLFSICAAEDRFGDMFTCKKKKKRNRQLLASRFAFVSVGQLSSYKISLENSCNVSRSRTRN